MGVKITGVARTQRAIKEKPLETAAKVALAVDGAVVTATPVDTGRARSNWIPTINNPAAGEVPETVVDKNGTVAQAAIANLVNSGFRSARYFITNNVPYIERLNDGWSKIQQPSPGFVQRQVKAAVALFK